jgi:hypothetical protein
MALVRGTLPRGWFFPWAVAGRCIARFSTRSRHRVCGSATEHIRVFSGSRFASMRLRSLLIGVGRNKTAKVRPNLPAKDYFIDDAAGCFGCYVVFGACARCRNADTCHECGALHFRGTGVPDHGADAEPFRRRGAQSALIAQRIKKGVAVGCKIVISEIVDP